MSKKKRNIIVVSIFVLSIGLVILSLIVSKESKDRQASQLYETLMIVTNEEEILFDLDYLKEYEATHFTALIDTNDNDTIEGTFTGVPLIYILNDKRISLEGAEGITFIAADVYMTRVSIDEVMDEDNIYIVYERNGQPSGTMKDGGTGPIEMIIKKDVFSQRWCKYLMEIKIQ